jgi:tetratricopeptide (TPR) repeat protein
LKDQLLHLKIRGPLRRALTLLPLLIALVGAWFSVRWFIGNTIAENLNPDDRGLENAQLAAALAPSDPLAHWTLAELEQSKLPADQFALAVAEFDHAVKLAPNDYRFWLAWGRALEQAGDIRKGEQAMRRAVELAPAYSYPRWYLGNLLLRDHRETEAFAELRSAAEANPELRPQIYSLLWQIYGKSPAEMSAALGSGPATRAEFARYLLAREQMDASLDIWRSLSSTDKQDNRTVGESLIKMLVDGKHFLAGLEVWNDLAVSDAARGKVGEILDGGFEQKARSETPGRFELQTKFSQQVQVAFDGNVRHGGAQSLQMVFKARGNVDLAVSQLVVIEPNTQYEFEGYLKTNDLKSATTPFIEIVDASSGVVLATTEPAPTGFNEWLRVGIPFKTDAKAEGILIRLNRGSCLDNTTCPIFGTIWYDDFTIKRRG